MRGQHQRLQRLVRSRPFVREAVGVYPFHREGFVPIPRSLAVTPCQFVGTCSAGNLSSRSLWLSISADV